MQSLVYTCSSIFETLLSIVRDRMLKPNRAKFRLQSTAQRVDCFYAGIVLVM